MKCDDKKSVVWSVLQNLLATVLLTLIGIWGSNSIENILETPFSSDFEIWGFYLLVLLFVILFTYLLRSREVKTINSQQELINKSNELEEIIRTLPPEGFLNLFSEKYGEAHTVYKELLLSGDKATKDEIELSIRGILLGVLRLTAFFDRADNDQSYGANVMIFTDSYKSDEKHADDLVKNLLFSNDDIDPQKLKGLLYLRHELSTNSDDDTSDLDKAISEILITLPVPNEVKSEETQKFKVLPGAPLAMALNSPNIYTNAETLDEWVSTEGDFNKSIAAQIKGYFCNGMGKDIKSFCSFPLSCDGHEPIAVLNIHKNKVGLLSQKDQFALYSKIMAPFLAMVAELVNKLDEVQK